MELLLKRINQVVNQVARENHLLLEELKHETQVLQKKKRKKNTKVKWMKQIGIIIDKSLSFKEHCKSRIAKARKMLGQLNGLRNCRWGMSANSWRSAYTVMITTVALWKVELKQRGQRDWEKEVQKLQYQDLQKCVNTTRGSKRELVNVRSELAIGSISWLGPNWVHVWVQEIDNIVVDLYIFQCNKTSLGISRSN